MPGAINQMQMLYNPEEDRIFFRVNSADKSEFRFWLTRRYALLLLKVLRQHFAQDPDISLQETSEGKQAVMNFKQEQALSNANFKKQFDEQATEYPLGQDTRLAFRITCNKVREHMQLGIHPKEGQGINLMISREINTSMTQLLQSAMKKAEWQITPTTQNRVSVPQGKRVIN